MLRSLLPLALCLSIAAAQISLYVPGFDQQPLSASVLGSDASATSYLITPAQPTGNEDPAGLPGSFTLTEGPSTASYHFVEEGALTLDYACAIASETATCTIIAGGAQANFPGTSTTVEPVVPISLRGSGGAGPTSAPAAGASVSASTSAPTVGPAGSSPSSVSKSGARGRHGATTGAAAVAGLALMLAILA